MLEAMNMNGKRPIGGGGKPFRYYRLYVSVFNQANAAVAISELELIDSNGTSIAPVVGVDAKASGQYGGYAPWFAFDGVWEDYPAACWQYNGAQPAWVSIDLQAPYGIAKYAIRCPNGTYNLSLYSARSWILQGSNDRLAWEDIHEVTNYLSETWASKEYHEWTIPVQP